MRPEFVSLSRTGIPAVVRKVADVGRRTVIEAMVADVPVNAIIEGKVPEIGSQVKLAFQADMTRLYVDGWIATKENGR